LATQTVAIGALWDGTLSVSLTYNDANGAVASATVVNNSPAPVPVTVNGNSLTFAPGTTTFAVPNGITVVVANANLAWSCP